MDVFSLDTLSSYINDNQSSLFYDYLTHHELDTNMNILSWCLLSIFSKSENENHQYYNLFCLVVGLFKDVNTQINGRLPLEIAYSINNIKFYIHLLLNGADPQKKNSKYLSTYEIIIKDKNEKFLSYIMRYEKSLIDEIQKRKSTH
ncbi:hypothetical protein [Kosakonia sp. S42]|uniref:hypothetical protein n=1 Tax=Kosakonia sp. S42 TaxID=2767458 RepID=UPI00190CA2D9|nr:hypothetical protein [Kosakonia sp. S42]MBK0019111.1 hypothetical protein [Kosakonia sp. S42]